MFQRNRAPQPPKAGLPDAIHAIIDRDRLGITSHQPERPRFQRLGEQCLHQIEHSATALVGSRHEIQPCTRQRGLQTPQVDNALNASLANGGASCQELLIISHCVRFDLEAIGGNLGIVRRAINQDRGCALRLKLCGQTRGNTLRIGKNYPGFSILSHRWLSGHMLSRPLRHDDSLSLLLNRFNRGKAMRQQQRLPLGGGQQRVILPLIRKAPPTGGEAKGEIEPAAGASRFEQHELAAGLEQLAHMGQGLGQIFGGMEHIGGNHQVGLSWRKALGDRCALDVERLIAHKVIGGKPVMHPLHKGRADIGKRIVGALLGQQGQQAGGRATGSRADLHNANAARRGQMRKRVLDKLLDQPIHELGNG